MKKIYLYTSAMNKREAIKKLCSEQQIVFCELNGSDINRTVSAICGINMQGGKKHKQAPALYMPQEVMLFYGIDDKALDEFLDAYNKAGIERIKRKAVVTPVNLGWTLYELIEELGKEE